MRQRFTAPAGTSLRGIGLQTGFTLGIEIDNASGSWLYIPTLETWVPPYTLGWAQTFPYAIASCDIIAGNGPAGEIGTTQGDGITVYLTDQAVAASLGKIDVGAPFIQGFTPISIASALVTVLRSVGALSTILPAIPGKRYRLRTTELTLAPVNGNPAINYDSGVVYTLDTGVGSNNIVAGRLSLTHPIDTRAFDSGLDAPVNTPIRLQTAADFATQIISYVVTYETV